MTVRCPSMGSTLVNTPRARFFVPSNAFLIKQELIVKQMSPQIFNILIWKEYAYAIFTMHLLVWSLH